LPGGKYFMAIRAFQPEDWAEWRRMRRALWPEATPAEHEAEMRAWLERPDRGVLVYARSGGGLCGFAEVSTRPYADGCHTSPVAFLEGWYVDADVRRQGVGRALVEAVEIWARERGLQELASDALLENQISHRAHERMGFSEVERAVRYRKVIGDRKSER
jgi:aminoglycoside 6'-N-acetyltransferase I